MYIYIKSYISRSTSIRYNSTRRASRCYKVTKLQCYKICSARFQNGDAPCRPGYAPF